ncbi:HAD-IIB family hydrolase [Candidatus Wolfebacteria bacterium]|nr:HAD-IIB family hydrolase [Candidatus Wolfebacteria bacterium]
MGADKKIIIFDLDGTLTKSKANLDREMSVFLCKLLKKIKVAIIGGGNYIQFKKQLLAPFNNYLNNNLKKNEIAPVLNNLFILPTSGAAFYEYQKNTWRQIYKNVLTPQEKKKILAAFKKSFQAVNYRQPQKIYGKVIEDRGMQITFSSLGQKAPLAKKIEWNARCNGIRVKLCLFLQKNLPEFEARLGGLTSIDITKKGIDKAYGISQILKQLSLNKKEAVYVGDALYKGGNDYAVKKTGIDTISVKNEKEIKNLTLK